MTDRDSQIRPVSPQELTEDFLSEFRHRKVIREIWIREPFTPSGMRPERPLRGCSHFPCRRLRWRPLRRPWRTAGAAQWTER